MIRAGGSGESCEVALGKTERKLHSLLELGQLIGLDLKIDDMLLRIAEKATDVMDADRFTIFLYNPATDELWSKVALGMNDAEIRFPAESGIAGHCFKSGETVNLSDAHNDPRFFKAVDDRTGYHTKTLLSMPFYGRSGQPLGVIQLLNKKGGVFQQEDETFLETFSNHAAVFVEMAQLQKARIDALEETRAEAERLGRAKDKALNHLSHELRTPLSLIQGALKILKRKVDRQAPAEEAAASFASLERNIARLSGIQQETDKILRAHQEPEWDFLVDELERFLGRMEDVSRVPSEIVGHLMALRAWVVVELKRRREALKPVPIWELVAGRVEEARKRSVHRAVSVGMDGDRSLVAALEPRIFTEVIDGILKNGIENTPDGGTVTVSLRSAGEHALVRVSDTGVGITEENRGRVFDGLFHAQDTDMYGSKKPYDFNAGGKGLELLLAKGYSKRYDFALAVESVRCPHIPSDRDLCPGDVRRCAFCLKAEDCKSAGGTTFEIRLPSNTQCSSALKREDEQDGLETSQV